MPPPRALLPLLLLLAAAAGVAVDAKRPHVAASGGPCRLDGGAGAAPVWGAW
jgi:hypothetical protein